MQTIKEITGTMDRMRVSAAIETQPEERRRSSVLAEVAHDGRNMATALALYCDLLEEPGVLTAGYAHYARELRLVVSASRRLVEKLAWVDAGSPVRETRGFVVPDVVCATRPAQPRKLDSEPNEPVASLRDELIANWNLLEAIAGPGIAMDVVAAGGAKPVRLTGEDLTRLLVNLVKNASEAMDGAGTAQIRLWECLESSDGDPWLLLSVEDSGPGIPDGDLERVFDRGYTTHRGVDGTGAMDTWPKRKRGLGLAIIRSIVEAAGGRVSAGNREGGGARFLIELPVWTE